MIARKTACAQVRIGLIAVAIACSAVIILAVYDIAASKARNDIRAMGERQLQIIALDLESVLEKFETLPFTLAFQPEAVQALKHPDDKAVIDRLNQTLQSIQRHAKVVATYLMDRNGRRVIGRATYANCAILQIGLCLASWTKGGMGRVPASTLRWTETRCRSKSMRMNGC